MNFISAGGQALPGKVMLTNFRIVFIPDTVRLDNFLEILPVTTEFRFRRLLFYFPTPFKNWSLPFF
jgi:hypothetical protein